MKKVLIVDDSRSWVFYHKENLLCNYKDIEIDTALSARDAYDLVFGMTSNPYDLIITDLHMEYDFEPLYAGEWLIQQIQMLKQYYKTKIYICSAASNIRMIAERYNVDFIPKPLASRDISVYENLL